MSNRAYEVKKLCDAMLETKQSLSWNFDAQKRAYQRSENALFMNRLMPTSRTKEEVAITDEGVKHWNEEIDSDKEQIKDILALANNMRLTKWQMFRVKNALGIKCFKDFLISMFFLGLFLTGIALFLASLAAA